MLLLHDRLKGFDIGVGIDGERIGHPYRERHDPIELAIALEDHQGAGAFGFVSLEKVLHIAQVVGNAEPRRVRKGFDVRLAGLERLVSEAAEDAEEYRTVASDNAVGREVQIEGDHRSLIVLPGDAPQVIAADERARGKRRFQRIARRNLLTRADQRTRRPRGRARAPRRLPAP